MAFLWPLLHLSAYYPLSIAFNSQTAAMEEITSYHVVYTGIVIALAIIAIARRTAACAVLSTHRAIPLGGGVAGAAGGALLYMARMSTSFMPWAIGLGIALAAFSLVILILAWGHYWASAPSKKTICSIPLSYILFSALWLIFSCASLSSSLLLIASPALSGFLLFLAQRSRETEPARETVEPSSFPRGIVILSLAFMYFGILGVKTLTAMQIGISVGALSNLHLIITAASSACISGIVFLLFRRQGYSKRALIQIFSFICFCYMASLLAVLLGSSSGYESFAGKRILVGSEHIVEMVLFIILACSASKNSGNPVSFFGFYLLFAVAIPSFVSSDLLYQTGMLNALARVNVIVPAVAVASFAVSSIAIMLLARASSHTDERPSTAQGQWEKDLCRIAFSSYDLSERELEVATLAYRGFSIKKIAQALFVSESTIKTHMTHVYRKLDIHSKQELIALADRYRNE